MGLWGVIEGCLNKFFKVLAIAIVSRSLNHQEWKNGRMTSRQKWQKAQTDIKVDIHTGREADNRHTGRQTERQTTDIKTVSQPDQPNGRQTE